MAHPSLHCDCCDHPLQHLIRGVVARNGAPIPYEGRTLEALMAELRDGLAEWEESQYQASPGHLAYLDLTKPPRLIR